jgi:hypothetical protein
LSFIFFYCILKINPLELKINPLELKINFREKGIKRNLYLVSLKSYYYEIILYLSWCVKIGIKIYILAFSILAN